MPRNTSFKLPNGLVASVYSVTNSRAEAVVKIFDVFWRQFGNPAETLKTHRPRYYVVEVQIDSEAIYLLYPATKNVKKPMQHLKRALLNQFAETLNAVAFIIYDGKACTRIESEAKIILKAIRMAITPGIIKLVSTNDSDPDTP